MPEPRIVTPEEAQARIASHDGFHFVGQDLAHTVATEPDRTRAAVVQALRSAASEHQKIADDLDEGPTSRSVYAVHAMLADAFGKRADAIENGADLT